MPINKINWTTENGTVADVSDVKRITNTLDADNGIIETLNAIADNDTGKIKDSAIPDGFVKTIMIDTINPPSDSHVLSYNATANRFEWVNPSEAGDSYKVKVTALDDPGYISSKLNSEHFTSDGNQISLVNELSLPSLTMGRKVTKFSVDGTFGDNSDTNVPTEKAIKAYFDTNSASKTSTDPQDFQGTLKVKGNVVYNQGNDGAGSGLDADKLDGKEGSDYAPVADPTFSGKVKFTNATAAIRKGNDSELILECTKPFIYNGTAYTNIWHAGNDGAGSGLDADTVDGYHVLSGVRPTSGLVKVGDYGVTGNATSMGGIDLNTLTAHGFYYGNYTANSPTGSTSTSFYVVNIINPSAGYLLQCAWETATTGKMYQRVLYNGTWTTWSQFATTADVSAAVAALVASSPATLDTLKELADALGDDPNFATTMTNALAAKAPLASPSLTGTPTAPTPAASDNSSKIITSSWIYSAIGTVATAMGFAWSFGANGYIKLPSWLKSLMLQWGYIDSTGANVDTTWTFPITFPSGWLFAAASPNVAGSTDYASITSAKGATSNLTFRKSNAGASSRTLLFAIGY